ncbi:reverse transcriptase domain-containing protein [Tanacetum coccineum]
MEKFETPPDSPPLTVIDPDDQPMWSNTRTVAPTPSFAIIQLPLPNNFHIKGTHMQMIRDNQFDGRIRSDPHRHVADFLEISILFQYGENHEEAVMLRTFPFSLSGEAKTWLNELDEGTITLWNEMREAFISRYFSPAKFKYDPTQGILDAGGIFLYNTPNEAFKILDDKVLLKIDCSVDSHINPKLKNVVSAGGSNIYSNHAILMEKFKALATKINSQFLKLRKELKEMRDSRRDNHASQIYMSDDTSMCDPMEANYVEYLEKTQRTKSLPRTKTTKPKHEFVYKPPSIQNENDKGDVKFIEEDETQPFPTMPNPNPITSNSPTLPPFLKDCTVHIPYTNAKTFADVVLSNHVGDKELKFISGVGNGALTKKKKKKNDRGLPKEPNK